MTETWILMLAEHGWAVPLQEATWCTTAPDINSSWRVAVHGESIPRSARNIGFKAVGVQITFDNSQERELHNRISRAWRAFFKYRVLLCCRSASWRDRFRLLQSVCSCLLWCSGSWNLTKLQVSKVKAVQLKMLHKMLAPRRAEGEAIDEFMQRVNSKLKRLKEANGFMDFDRLYYRSLYKWAGHVARMAQYDQDRPTLRILKHKSWDWIQNMKRQYGS